jgi:hypothetical protein
MINEMDKYSGKDVLMGPKLIHSNANFQYSCWKFPSPVQHFLELIFLNLLIDTTSYHINYLSKMNSVDFLSGADSTIFGSLVPQNSFNSEIFELSCSGVQGTVADSNQVIIAQLTTLGELSFNINITVEEMVDGFPTLVNYVSSDTLLGDNEKYNPYLSYPYSCGCNDGNYLEYNSSFVCYEEGSCVTPVVFGCTDSLACNYDPQANINLGQLCCYPGSCAGSRQIL